MRRGALLNEAQLSGMLPTSVAGGENAPGNWSLMAGFCGPGSLMLLGFLALMAPCGGSFGLPKLISLFYRSRVRGRGHCRRRHRTTDGCCRQHLTPLEHRLSLLVQK